MERARILRAVAAVCLALAGCTAVRARGDPALPFVAGPLDAETMESSSPCFAFHGDAGLPAVLFVRTGDVEACEPRILVRAGGAWLVVRLPGDRYSQCSWQAVYASPDRRRVWGILDTDVESPGWALEIVRSEDGGLSWRPGSSVAKPSYLARFDSLRMDEEGNGVLAVGLDEDYTEEVRSGLYECRTSDRGRTWSEFRHVPNRSKPPAPGSFRRLPPAATPLLRAMERLEDLPPDPGWSHRTEWGDPRSGLRARLLTTAARYAPGEEMTARFELQNVSSRRVSLDGPDFLPILSGPDDHPFDRAHGCNAVFTATPERDDFCILWRKLALFSQIRTLVLLPPRGTYSVTFRCTPRRGPDTPLREPEAAGEPIPGLHREIRLDFPYALFPGRYRLEVSYTRDAGGPRRETVRTPPLEIEIVRGPRV